MKHSSTLIPILTIALILSACGAKATPPPTLSAVDMQSTSLVVAGTMIAQTQAAIPTVTPPPPTEVFTNTLAPITAFVPSPASALTATPVSSGNSGAGDPCVNKVLPAVLEGGKTVKIRISNSTRVAVNVSVYLNRTIPPIVCGYRSYSIEAGQSIVIADLVEGCFTLWAWNPEPKGYFIVTNGASTCLDGYNPAAFDISTKDIKLK